MGRYDPAVAQDTKCDVLIVGGGTGGTAAAIALQNSGLTVVLTEPTDWIGGQLTSQAVPPDEHPWIESCGCTATYREFRNRVRAWYRLSGLLQPSHANDKTLNPGGGWVSRLCCPPNLAHQALLDMLAPAQTAGLHLHLETVPVAAQTNLERVTSVTFRTGDKTWTCEPTFVLDATETGDLLPLTQTPYNLGAESQAQTGEPNAVPGPPEPENVQGFTWCAAIGYDPQNNHTIPRPDQYGFWKDCQPQGWPDRLLSFTMLHVQKGGPVHFPLFSDDWFNLFSYRQIVDPAKHTEPTEPASVMNWPMNDYYLGTVIDVHPDTANERYEASKQLTLSMLYWLQTECGYPGLRLRPDLTGTPDGLAKAPYIRESRRMQTLTTLREQDVAAYCNPGLVLAPQRPDSVGVGAYRIDLHPSANGRPTIDTSTLPFQLPVGTLVSTHTKNLLPACKNLGVTHIANGCTRLHPVEWNIGESAALLAAYCLKYSLTPEQVATSHFEDFQKTLHSAGIETDWPRFHPL